MQKICLCIDGVNGTGKTRFIQQYAKDNKCIKYIPLVSNGRLESYEWWFHQSTPKELAYELFLVMRERYQRALQSSCQVLILDKGINTFLARLYATLKVRNVEEKESIDTVEYFKQLCRTMDEVNYVQVLFGHEYVKEFDDSLFLEYNRIQAEYIQTLRTDARIEATEYEKMVLQVEEAVNQRLFHVNSVQLLDLQNLKAEGEYRKTIVRITDSLLTYYKEDIMMLALVGSCYFGTTIKGWSDIDLLIILNNEKNRQEIYDMAEHEDVHIGINCFTKEDIYHNVLDVKNKWYLYYIQNDMILPLYTTEFVIPYIERKHLIGIEDINLKEVLFYLDRFLYIHHADLKSVIKKIIIALKIYLNKIGIITANYKDVFRNASTQFGLNIDETLFYGKDAQYLEKVAKDVVNIYDQYTFLS